MCQICRLFGSDHIFDGHAITSGSGGIRSTWINSISRDELSIMYDKISPGSPSSYSIPDEGSNLWLCNQVDESIDENHGIEEQKSHKV